MMLDVGSEFQKDGVKYCIIDFLELDLKKYALVSIEKRKKRINFGFFEINQISDGYNFKRVTDENINNMLFEKMERSAYGEQ